ncbi:hypothetical protein FDP41_010503 [Naegleria fowleri]|uniref:Ubiquitin-like protein ATG12 n=1 Tax=Naegleria fowleri TaxID=5763 RepID=A0A6A5CD25_NAEFO|nr:uncharacterized protein FDP41_010503 [Naegleria fowleri]KAF0983438.1 hypothetical protein FDP41_010503 [Naegleria fowleri]
MSSSVDSTPTNDHQQETESNPTTETSTTEEGGERKITLLFQAVGNAPILKKKKFKINASSSFNEVIYFLRDKLLRINNPNQSLFLYCGQAFCPNPDDFVGDLYDHFNTNNMLVINYSLKVAWG